MNILFSTLKSTIKTVRAFFSFEHKPCEIMAELKNFKSITVYYPATVVLNSIDRPETAKVWHVAVTTADPELQPKTHAEWMLNIQMSRANTSAYIGELSRKETLTDAEKYSENVPIRPFIKVKKSNT